MCLLVCTPTTAPLLLLPFPSCVHCIMCWTAVAAVKGDAVFCKHTLFFLLLSGHSGCPSTAQLAIYSLLAKECLLLP
jgi:hypothetical protein